MVTPWLSLFVLAFALSLDGFGVGVTYGLRKLKIPLLSIFIISLCSGVVVGISMQAGTLLADFVNPDTASVIGAVILVLMGGWSLMQMILQRDDGGPLKNSGEGANDGAADEGDVPAKSGMEQEKPPVFSLELRRIGIVIQILRTPSSADMDASGSISPAEALVLGIALSLDAFGAGLGAALLGFHPLWTALAIMAFSGTFLALGLKTGLRFADNWWMKHAAVLPALMLIVMGIMKLL